MDHQDPPDRRDNDKSTATRRLSRRLLLHGCGAAAIGVPAALAAYWAAVEVGAIRVTRADVPIEGLPDAMRGLTIGVLSDTHCDHEAALERARTAANLLAAQKPDLVAFAGDLITHKPRRWSRPAAEALAPAAGAPLGSYAVLGNHDWWGGAPDLITRDLTDVGYVVLRNQARPAGHPGFWMVGLDSRFDSHHNVDRALMDVPATAPRLLLIHEPDYANEAPPGFLLQISGHSHGGQIRLPWLPPLHTPGHARSHVEGLCRGTSHPVYVSRGVGTVGVRLRLFCPPEANLLRLVPAPGAE